jgi:translation initiation factor eIF-2B subunit epsilon
VLRTSTDSTVSPGLTLLLNDCECSTSSYSKTLNIQCISSTSAQSIGDALRQLDAMQILNPKMPFLLLHSPVVSNVDLSRLVRDHKKLREEDKNVIMTVGVGVGGR